VIDAEFNKCDVEEYIDDPPNVIAALTVTGPPGSGLTDFDLKPCWIGEDSIWNIFWCPDELQIAVSGFYTFRVDDVDGDYFVTTDYLEATPQLAVPVHVSPVDGAMGVPVNVTLSWDPVELAEDYRVDMEYSDDRGNTWQGMPNQYPVNPTDTEVTVNLDPDTDYRWRVRARRFDVYGEMDTESRSDWQVRARRFDVYGEMDTESRSDWQEFATYVFTIGGYLQYRTFEDGSNQYRGWLGFTKYKDPIDESDITQIELKDSEGNPVIITVSSLYSDSYFSGDWIESDSRVEFSGPYYYSGFGIGFPEGTNLAPGTYTYEATTSEDDLLTLTRDFPGPMVLPVVDDDSMKYKWLVDGGLHLTWSVTDTDTYDELRIFLADQDWGDLLYVTLPADKEELTIPAEWIQEITDFKNPSSAIWRVRTRSYAADGNVYARGLSETVDIPWNGPGD
jgi:hypothetical protein